MEYTGYQLLWLFFLYSLAGWCLEVCTAAVKRRKFVNIGYVNAPFCLIYGFAGVSFALFLTELKGSFFFLFLGGMVIAGFLEYVSGFFLERIFHRKWWDYSGRRFQINGYICLENTIVWGIGAVLMVQFLNPLLIRLFQVIPAAVRQIGLWCLLGILILDIAGSSAAVVQLHHNLARLAVQVSEDMQRLSDSLDHALTGRIQKRMVQAYPNLSVEELLRQQRLEKQRRKELAEQAHIFAYGCSFYKLVSLFFIGAFLGDIIETIFCYVTAGVLMSRSSVVYGPFSIVWGLGCVLLTAFLYQYREKSDRYIFLAGTVLGGAYEYICSVFTELVFGTIFWDYSAIPFNLGGRINLLYCFFWGIVAVVWLKIIYPFLSGWIEKIPKKKGIIGCNLLIVFMVCNMVISGLALSRYVVRQTEHTEVPAASQEVSAGENTAGENTAGENAATGNVVIGNAAQQGAGTAAGTAAGAEGEEKGRRWLDEFLDEHFPDERIERIYPNAKLVEE